MAEPVVDDAHLHKGKSFHYPARVEVRAEVTPKDYDGVEVGRAGARSRTKRSTRALQHKREELTEYKVIEGRAEMVDGAQRRGRRHREGHVGDRTLERTA